MYAIFQDGPAGHGRVPVSNDVYLTFDQAEAKCKTLGKGRDPEVINLVHGERAIHARWREDGAGQAWTEWLDAEHKAGNITEILAVNARDPGTP